MLCSASCWAPWPRCRPPRRTPTRAGAIRFVVPFAAGGPSDIVARVLAPRMAATLGQPVVVENRAGAGGVTGVDVVAKAAPDGYTFGIGSAGALAVSPNLGARHALRPGARPGADHAGRAGAGAGGGAGRLAVPDDAGAGRRRAGAAWRAELRLHRHRAACRTWRPSNCAPRPGIDIVHVSLQQRRAARDGDPAGRGPARLRRPAGAAAADPVRRDARAGRRHAAAPVLAARGPDDGGSRAAGGRREQLARPGRPRAHAAGPARRLEARRRRGLAGCRGPARCWTRRAPSRAATAAKSSAPSSRSENQKWGEVIRRNNISAD